MKIQKLLCTYKSDNRAAEEMLLFLKLNPVFGDIKLNQCEIGAKNHLLKIIPHQRRPLRNLKAENHHQFFFKKIKVQLKY